MLLRTYYLTKSMVQLPVNSEFIVGAVVQELPSVAFTVEGGILLACSEEIIDRLSLKATTST